MLDFLRRVPLFANLSQDDLAMLAEQVEEVKLKAGEELFAEGSPGDRAYVIKEGELEIIKTSGSRPLLLAVRKAGEVIGEMALLEDAPRMASVRARSNSQLLAVGQEPLEQLLNTSPSASRAMLHTVLARWRNVTAAQRQSDKMAQLGTLTAGVAHELNNPAAAVKRGADQLQSTLEGFSQAQAAITQLDLSSQQQAQLTVLVQEAQRLAFRPPILDSLARSDREQELEEWLENWGVEDAWELAPILVDLNLDGEGLAKLAGHFNPEHLPAVVAWLGATFTAYNLLAEIGQGAGRISEIVKALKSYAYLDQAPVQEVDIHEGLDNTLLILRSKLKEGINVRREYAPDLPRIQAFGSELNQVWTNLIDNATDAMEGHGQLVLRTRHQDDWVIVEVEDDGPGIPPEIRNRIFDAFFTTKPPGKGTGMGLDISYQIVTLKHRGDIKVFSRPGRTTFQVWLPINFEHVSHGSALMPAVLRLGDEELRRILQENHVIAVVGISERADRPAHIVPAYLQRQGYQIIPVNPQLAEVLGQQAYPNLLAVTQPVDVVQIFRRSEHVLPIVRDAIQIGAKVIWMQLGIINEQAAEEARSAGLEVAMDTCMMAAHRRLLASLDT